MSTFDYDTNERDRPLVVWIIQCILLFLCIGILVSMWRNYQFCSSADIIQNCWPLLFIPRLVAGLLQLGAFLKLFYGLEKGRHYARWLTGILIIVWVVVSTNETHYTQLVLGAIMPDQGLPAPPYKCWQSELALDNSASFCGYNSYAQLVRKVLAEICILALAASPAVWLITSPASKRYFARKKT